MSESKSYEELINKAHAFEKSGQWNNALDLYNEAITLYPGIINLYYERALVRSKLADYQGAVDDYAKILHIDPSQGKAYFCRGFLAGFYFSDYERAIADFQKVSTSDPFISTANFYSGILYYYKNDHQNAELEYDKALKLNPGYGEAYFFRALLFEETASYQKALADYNAAVKNGFACSELYYNLGLLYAKFRNFDQAAEEFTRSYSTARYRNANLSEGLCHYYPDGRRTFTEVIYPDSGKIENLSAYLEKGFVRYANYYFRHICKDCKACIPLRVLTDNFIVSRSIRRTMKMNSDLRIVIPDAPLIDAVRINLFEKYYKEKHNTHNKENLERDVAFRHFGFKNSYEIDFYLGNDLVAVHIVDEGADALYASYIYYDTGYMKRRLGVFCIAKAIEFAKKIGKTFYYMGWYIENVQAMSYKKQFRPNQLLIDNQWKDFCQ